MDPLMAIKIVTWIAKGVGTLDAIRDIAKRAEAGETITDAEIDEASERIDETFDEFKNS